MKVLKILVEGSTELNFVKEVLYNHLLKFEIITYPVVGNNQYCKVKKDLNNLLGESQNNTITTMKDFYHLSNDFPGYSTIPNGTCYDKVNHLEKEWATDIKQPHFIPYLQLHEFEALLFSSVNDIISAFPDQNNRNNLNSLLNITTEFNNPEEINEGEYTSPAKRLKAIFKGYKKPYHGAIISKRIGINIMREHCPHFNEWLLKLESLGTN